MAWESDELRAAVEALLFVSDAPLSVPAICDVLPQAQPGSVRMAIEELSEIYSASHGGLQIVSVAGGYHVRTRPDVSHWVERLLRKRRKMRLSQAALETLAIVAYKQPVTKMELESIRGVDVGGVLGTLLERNLVSIRGRSKGPGRPLLYATTKEFLDHFGLNDLEDLPSLDELESLLAKRDEAAAEGAPEGDFEGTPEVEVERAGAGAAEETTAEGGPEGASDLEGERAGAGAEVERAQQQSPSDAEEEATPGQISSSGDTSRSGEEGPLEGGEEEREPAPEDSSDESISRSSQRVDG